MAKILVVDDDRDLSDIIAFTLEREGFDVARAYDGQQALDQFEKTRPDLLVLDGMMPVLDGFQVCERLRSRSPVPIIMLTVINQESDIIRAFDLGADDYIAKPFSPRQLVARIKVALRHAGTTAPDLIAGGGLKLDAERHEVIRVDSTRVRLTPLEFRLLRALMLNCGKVLSPESIVEQVWDPKEHVGDKMLLKGLIRRLREKVEPDPSQPLLIRTVPGAGYVFSA